MNDSLQHAINLARGGQIAAAYDLLSRLVEREPANPEAWLWLGGVARDPRERFRALQRVLELDPTNARAAQGLAALRTQQPELFAEQAVALGGERQVASQPFEMTATHTPPSSRARSYETLTFAAPNEVMPPDTPSIHDSPTIPQPVVSGSVPPAVVELRPGQEQAMASIAPQRMPAAATQQMPTTRVQPRRNIVARAARFLLVVLWLAVTLLTVITAALAARFFQALQADTGAPVPEILRLAAANSGIASLTTALLGVAIVTGALGVISALVTFGMMMRWRVAHILSIIVGVLVAALGVILGVTTFSVPSDITGLGAVLGVDKVVGDIIAAVLLAWPLLLSFVAWSEFWGRRARNA